MTTYIKPVLDQSDNNIIPITTTTAVLNPDGTTTAEQRLQSIESLLVSFNGLRTGLVPLPPEGYSSDLGVLYMRGDGSWSVFRDDAALAISDSYLPITGGTLQGSAPYINGLSSTLPTNTQPEIARTFAASLGMVEDRFVSKLGDVMDSSGTGLDMNGTVLTGIPEPEYNTDAANKKYVDAKCSNREWSHTDSMPYRADGTKMVQSVYVNSNNTDAQNTLTFYTPMELDTTCHVFAYGGSPNMFGSGTIKIPFNIAGSGASAGSSDVIIVDNVVVWNRSLISLNSGKQITIPANQIVEISVMYTSVMVDDSTFYRTIIKTSYIQ